MVVIMYWVRTALSLLGVALFSNVFGLGAHQVQSADQLVAARLAQAIPNQSVLQQPAANTVAQVPVNLWHMISKQFTYHNSYHQPEVAQQIIWYLHHKTLLQAMLKHARNYLYYVFQQTQQQHLPAELTLIPLIESGYNPQAYSPAGATGLWQMLPGTALAMGLQINWWYDARRDTLAATQAALRYFALLHRQFGDWLVTLAAYNAGSGQVRKVISSSNQSRFWQLPLPQETRNYVARVLALAQIIRHATFYGIELPKIKNQPYFSAIRLTRQVSVSQLATMSGLTRSQVHTLNPALLRAVTRPDVETIVVLPVVAVQQFSIRWSAALQHTVWQYHPVRQGETLASIASIYHTSVAKLKRFNHYQQLPLPGQGGILVPLKTTRQMAKATVKMSSPDDSVGSRSLKTLLAKIYGPASG